MRYSVAMRALAYSDVLFVIKYSVVLKYYKWRLGWVGHSAIFSLKYGKENIKKLGGFNV